MGGGLLGAYVLNKASGLAFAQAKKYVTAKVTDLVKERAGALVFGQKVYAEGEPFKHSGHQDLLGYEMFEAPKPTRIVKLFCKSDVIEVGELDKILYRQRQDIFNRGKSHVQNNSLLIVSKLDDTEIEGTGEFEKPHPEDASKIPNAANPGMRENDDASTEFSESDDEMARTMSCLSQDEINTIKKDIKEKGYEIIDSKKVKQKYVEEEDIDFPTIKPGSAAEEEWCFIEKGEMKLLHGADVDVENLKYVQSGIDDEPLEMEIDGQKKTLDGWAAGADVQTDGNEVKEESEPSAMKANEPPAMREPEPPAMREPEPSAMRGPEPPPMMVEKESELLVSEKTEETADGLLGGKGPTVNPNDAVTALPENKPIDLQSFKEMVVLDPTTKKANKGYIRFVKTNGGENVGLGKVGNKCGLLMSWRVNVTHEHNRQMRHLFANSLFAAWRGNEGVRNHPEAFGSYLSSNMLEIRSRILSKEKEGRLLDRRTVSECITDYEKLFNDPGSRQKIATSYIEDYLFKKYGDGKNIDAFLQTYGKDLKLAGIDGKGEAKIESYQQLIGYIVNAGTDPAKIKEAMYNVGEAFFEMGASYRQDKIATDYLESLVASPSTGHKLTKEDKEIPVLKGALLRRLSRKYRDYAFGVKNITGWGQVLNLYMDQLFPKYESVQRLTWAGSGKMTDKDKKKLTDAFSLERLVEEVHEFAEWLQTDASKLEAAFGTNSLDYLKADLERQGKELQVRLVACYDQNGNLIDGKKKECESIQKEMARVFDDSGVIAGIEKTIGEAGFSKNVTEHFKYLEIPEKRNENASYQEQRQWSKAELWNVICDGQKALTDDLKFSRLVTDYCRNRFKEMSWVFESDDTPLRKQMEKLRGAFEKDVKIALCANVTTKKDISLSQMVDEFVEFLTRANNSELNSLETGDVQHLSEDPAKKINPNYQLKTLDVFVTTATETLVRQAMKAKVEATSDGATFLRTLEDYEEKMKVVVPRLCEVFDAVNIKDKVFKMASFMKAVQMYMYKGRVDQKKVEAVKDSYSDEARTLVNRDLLLPFFEEDLYPLLSIADPKEFKKQAEMKLKLRSERMLSDLYDTQVANFYKTHLEFDMGSAEAADSILQKSDPQEKKEEGLDPKQVGVKYLAVYNEFTKAFAAKNRSAAFKALGDDEIERLFKERSEKLWRRDVVNHAPGQHFFQIVDWVLFQIQNFFNVSAENRKVAINKEWLDERAKSLTNELKQISDSYVQFEEDLGNACLDQVQEELKNEKDFKAASDDRKHGLALDVMGRFKTALAAIQKKFIAGELGENPDPKKLARELIDGAVVRETFGDVLNTRKTLVESWMISQEMKDHLARFKIKVVRNVNDPKDLLWAKDGNGLESYQDNMASMDLMTRNREQKETAELVAAVGYCVDLMFEKYCEEVRRDPLAYYDKRGIDVFCERMDAKLKAFFTSHAKAIKKHVSGISAALDKHFEERVKAKKTVDAVTEKAMREAATKGHMMKFCELVLAKQGTNALYNQINVCIGNASLYKKLQNVGAETSRHAISRNESDLKKMGVPEEALRTFRLEAKKVFSAILRETQGKFYDPAVMLSWKKVDPSKLESAMNSEIETKTRALIANPLNEFCRYDKFMTDVRSNEMVDLKLIKKDKDKQKEEADRVQKLTTDGLVRRMPVRMFDDILNSKRRFEEVRGLVDQILDKPEPMSFARLVQAYCVLNHFTEDQATILTQQAVGLDNALTSSKFSPEQLDKAIRRISFERPEEAKGGAIGTILGELHKEAVARKAKK